jgi:hypothetical protein
MFAFYLYLPVCIGVIIVPASLLSGGVTHWPTVILMILVGATLILIIFIGATLILIIFVGATII